MPDNAGQCCTAQSDQNAGGSIFFRRATSGADALSVLPSVRRAVRAGFFSWPGDTPSLKLLPEKLRVPTQVPSNRLPDIRWGGAGSPCQSA